MSKASLGICLTAGLLVAGAPLQAQSLEEFYKGRQVRLIISTAAGGDYDLWARMIGRHMGKYIPGNPTFVPQNMPGAGQLTATNHLYNIADKDGSAIGMIGRNLPNHALLRREGVRFDPLKFNWLGSPELTNRVCIAMDTAPVKKAEDLFATEMLVGGAGAGTAVSNTPILLRNLLGMKFNLVEGYGSSNGVVLAMERGEVHGICQSITSLQNTKAEWFKSGKIRVLFNTERTPLKGIEAPSVFQFAKTEEQRQILALYSSSVEIGRPMVAPPGVPADRVEALRRAFDRTVRDATFRAEADKQGLVINALTGEELTKIVADLMATPPDLVKKMRAMLKK